MPRKKKESKIIPFNGGKGLDTSPENVENEKADIPKVPAELVDTKSVEQMSIADINKLRQDLQTKRDIVQALIDQEKLDQAGKLASLMHTTLDKMQSMILSPDDFDSRAYKELSESYDRLAKHLPNLTRLDTNSNGEFMEIHLSIKRNG